MISGEETTQRRFSNAFYRHLWAFFPEQVAMMTFPGKRSLSGEKSGISLSRIKS